MFTGRWTGQDAGHRGRPQAGQLLRGPSVLQHAGYFVCQWCEHRCGSEWGREKKCLSIIICIHTIRNKICVYKLICESFKPIQRDSISRLSTGHGIHTVTSSVSEELQSCFHSSKLLRSSTALNSSYSFSYLFERTVDLYRLMKFLRRLINNQFNFALRRRVYGTVYSVLSECLWKKPHRRLGRDSNPWPLAY